MPLDFATLLSPVSPEQFLADVLGQRFLYGPQGGTDVSGVLGWDVLNRILNHTALTFPRARLWKKGPVPSESFVRGASAENPGGLLVAQTNELLQTGATLVIGRADELHEPILRLCQTAECLLEVPVRASICASVVAIDAIDTNWEDRDLIVLQIEGQKRWTLFGETVKAPTENFPPSDPEGPPVWQGLLTPGDFLYIPRGWWYGVASPDGASLHVAMEFHNPTGLDLAGRLLTRLHEWECLRRDCLRFGSDEKQGAYLSLVQHTITKACAEPGLLRGYLTDLRGLAEPRPAFSLPWGAAECSVDTPLDYFVVPQIRVPHARRYYHLEDSDTLVVLHDSKAFRFPETRQTLLDRLLDPPPATLGSLVEGRDATESEDVIRFVLELVNSGMVALRPGVKTAETI